MKKSTGKYGYSYTTKAIAFFVLSSFTLLNTFNPTFSYAQIVPSSTVPLSKNLDLAKIAESLAIPESMGTIQKRFWPEKGNDQLIIYVQNAHSNLDSERNTQNLIAYFQKELNLPLVLLEGGEGKLDNLFFKSFPDKELKEKLLNDYLKKGDLSGGETASILFDQYDTEYYGIENQALYDQNKKSFLEAIGKEPEISRRLDTIQQELNRKAKSVLNENSLKFREKSESFQKEGIDLMEYAKFLRELYEQVGAGFPRPSHMKGEATSPLPMIDAYPELSKILNAEQNEKRFKNEDVDAATTQMIQTFQKKALPKLPKSKQMEINQMIQMHRIGHLGQGALVQHLEKVAKETNFFFETPEILKPAARHAQTISSIKGTQIFEELKKLEQELRNKLPETEPGKKLLSDEHSVYLLRQFSKLEILPEEWEFIKDKKVSVILSPSAVILSHGTALTSNEIKGESGLSKAKNLPASRASSAKNLHADPSAAPQDDMMSLDSLFTPHYLFYQLADERDKVLFKNISNIIKKEKAKVVLVSTGGFHVSGIMNQLKESNTPFILISPKINQFTERSVYLNAMEDKRSFMNYFNGSLWDALAQDYASKLAASLKEEDLTPNLKRWRDRIIQNSIAEGRITEAGSYTKYVDALVQALRKEFEKGSPLEANGRKRMTEEEIRKALDRELNSFFNVYFEKIESLLKQKIQVFTDGLSQLWKTKDVTPKSIAQLLDRVNAVRSSNLSASIVLINKTSPIVLKERVAREARANLSLQERIQEYISIIRDNPDLLNQIKALDLTKVSPDATDIYSELQREFPDDLPNILARIQEGLKTGQPAARAETRALEKANEDFRKGEELLNQNKAIEAEETFLEAKGQYELIIKNQSGTVEAQEAEKNLQVLKLRLKITSWEKLESPLMAMIYDWNTGERTMQQIPRRHARQQGLAQTSVFLIGIGPDGKLVLQERGTDNYLFPGTKTWMTTGGVDVNEKQGKPAVVREFKEEWKLKEEDIEDDRLSQLIVEPDFPEFDHRSYLKQYEFTALTSEEEQLLNRLKAQFEQEEQKFEKISDRVLFKIHPISRILYAYVLNESAAGALERLNNYRNQIVNEAHIPVSDQIENREFIAVYTYHLKEEELKKMEPDKEEEGIQGYSFMDAEKLEQAFHENPTQFEAAIAMILLNPIAWNQVVERTKMVTQLVEGQKIQGHLFDPTGAILAREGLTKAAVQTSEAKPIEEVRTLLKRAQDQRISLEIEAPLRLLDGPGTQLDLFDYEKALTPVGAKKLRELPSSLTVTGEYSVTFRFEPSDNENAVEYVAPDLGIHDAVVGKVNLTPDGKLPRGYEDGPAYIFSNMFNLRGVRITLVHSPLIAAGGGMETSDIFLDVLFSAASMLSSSDWSQAKILSERVKFGNELVGRFSGGQASLAIMTGGVSRHIWLAGLKDQDGNLINPYSGFSFPILQPDDYPFVEAHMMHLLPGREKEKVDRGLMTVMWVDLIRDKDPVAAPLFRELITNADEYMNALAQKDMATVVKVMNRHVDIRDALHQQWLSLAMLPPEKQPEYARKYTALLQTHPLLKALHEKYGVDIIQISPYSDYAKEVIQAGRKEGISITPLGQGGPGSTLIAVSSKPNILESFFKRQDYGKFDEHSIELRGYAPLKISNRPIQFRGFKELGLREPAPPTETIYDESVGKFIRSETRALPIVNISNIELPKKGSLSQKKILLVYGGLGAVVPRLYQQGFYEYKDLYNMELDVLGRQPQAEAWKKIHDLNLPYSRYYTEPPKTKPDGVLIVTRPDSHKEILEWAMANNIPAFVEKPLGLPGHIESINALYQANPTKIFAIEFFLDNPAVLRAAEMLTEKNLGQLRAVKGRAIENVPVEAGREWLLKPEISGGGIGMMDIMVHLVAMGELSIQHFGKSFKDFVENPDKTFLARYDGAPPGTETYAHVEGKIGDVQVEMSAGKGVHTTTYDMSFIGSKTILEVDLGFGDTIPSVTLKDLTDRVIQRYEFPESKDIGYHSTVRKIFDVLQNLSHIPQEERDFRIQTTALAVKILSNVQNQIGQHYYTHPFGADMENYNPSQINSKRAETRDNHAALARVVTGLSKPPRWANAVPLIGRWPVETSIWGRERANEERIFEFFNQEKAEYLGSMKIYLFILVNALINEHFGGNASLRRLIFVPNSEHEGASQLVIRMTDTFSYPYKLAVHPDKKISAGLKPYRVTIDELERMFHVQGLAERYSQLQPGEIPIISPATSDTKKLWKMLYLYIAGTLNPESIGISAPLGGAVSIGVMYRKERGRMGALFRLRQNDFQLTPSEALLDQKAQLLKNLSSLLSRRIGVILHRHVDPLKSELAQTNLLGKIRSWVGGNRVKKTHAMMEERIYQSIPSMSSGAARDFEGHIMEARRKLMVLDRETALKNDAALMEEWKNAKALVNDLLKFVDESSELKNLKTTVGDEMIQMKTEIAELRRLMEQSSIMDVPVSLQDEHALPGEPIARAETRRQEDAILFEKLLAGEKPDAETIENIRAVVAGRKPATLIAVVPEQPVPEEIAQVPPKVEWTPEKFVPLGEFAKPYEKILKRHQLYLYQWSAVQTWQSKDGAKIQREITFRFLFHLPQLWSIVQLYTDSSVEKPELLFDLFKRGDRLMRGLFLGYPEGAIQAHQSNDTLLNHLQSPSFNLNSRQVEAIEVFGSTNLPPDTGVQSTVAQWKVAADRLRPAKTVLSGTQMPRTSKSSRTPDKPRAPPQEPPIDRHNSTALRFIFEVAFLAGVIVLSSFLTEKYALNYFGSKKPPTVVPLSPREARPPISIQFQNETRRAEEAARKMGQSHRARAETRNAIEAIKRKIEENGGRITFKDFMEEALYGPFGYYTNKVNIGTEVQSDFFTFPELVPVAFAQGVANELLQMWRAMGSPTEPGSFQIVEMGAGRGILAENILKGVQRSALENDEFKTFFTALSYVIVEISPELRQQQEQRLKDKGFPIRWIAGSTVDASINVQQGVFISNELPDVFPVHRVKRIGGELQEAYVEVDRNGKFRETFGPLSETNRQEIEAYLQKGGERYEKVLEQGGEIPVNLDLTRWQKNISNNLKRGYVLTIDYGPGREYPISQSTVRTYSKNRPYLLFGFRVPFRFVNFILRWFKVEFDAFWRWLPLSLRGPWNRINPFKWLFKEDHTYFYDAPGEVDITADVDPQLIFASGLEAGLRVESLESQTQFFTRQGITGSDLKALTDRGFFVAIQSKGMMPARAETRSQEANPIIQLSISRRMEIGDQSGSVPLTVLNGLVRKMQQPETKVVAAKSRLRIQPQTEREEKMWLKTSQDLGIGLVPLVNGEEMASFLRQHQNNLESIKIIGLRTIQVVYKNPVAVPFRQPTKVLTFTSSISLDHPEYSVHFKELKSNVSAPETAQQFYGLMIDNLYQLSRKGNLSKLYVPIPIGLPTPAHVAQFEKFEETLQGRFISEEEWQAKEAERIKNEEDQKRQKIIRNIKLMLDIIKLDLASELATISDASGDVLRTRIQAAQAEQFVTNLSLTDSEAKVQKWKKSIQNDLQELKRKIEARRQRQAAATSAPKSLGSEAGGTFFTQESPSQPSDKIPPGKLLAPKKSVREETEWQRAVRRAMSSAPQVIEKVRPATMDHVYQYNDLSYREEGEHVLFRIGTHKFRIDRAVVDHMKRLANVNASGSVEQLEGTIAERSSGGEWDPVEQFDFSSFIIQILAMTIAYQIRFQRDFSPFQITYGKEQMVIQVGQQTVTLLRRSPYLMSMSKRPSGAAGTLQEKKDWLRATFNLLFIPVVLDPATRTEASEAFKLVQGQKFQQALIKLIAILARAETRSFTVNEFYREKILAPLIYQEDPIDHVWVYDLAGEGQHYLVVESFDVEGKQIKIEKMSLTQTEVSNALYHLRRIAIGIDPVLLNLEGKGFSLVAKYNDGIGDPLTAAERIFEFEAEVKPGEDIVSFTRRLFDAMSRPLIGHYRINFQSKPMGAYSIHAPIQISAEKLTQAEYETLKPKFDLVNNLEHHLDLKLLITELVENKVIQPRDIRESPEELVQRMESNNDFSGHVVVDEYKFFDFLKTNLEAALKELDSPRYLVHPHRERPQDYTVDTRMKELFENTKRLFRYMVIDLKMEPKSLSGPLVTLAHRISDQENGLNVNNPSYEFFTYVFSGTGLEPEYQSQESLQKWYQKMHVTRLNTFPEQLARAKPRTAQWDQVKDSLRLATLELMANAAQAAANFKGKEGKISWAVDETNRGVEIVIRDNGPGWDLEQLREAARYFLQSEQELSGADPEWQKDARDIAEGHTVDWQVFHRFLYHLPVEFGLTTKKPDAEVPYQEIAGSLNFKGATPLYLTRQGQNFTGGRSRFYLQLLEQKLNAPVFESRNQPREGVGFEVRLVIPKELSPPISEIQQFIAQQVHVAEANFKIQSESFSARAETRQITLDVDDQIENKDTKLEDTTVEVTPEIVAERSKKLKRQLGEMFIISDNPKFSPQVFTFLQEGLVHKTNNLLLTPLNLRSIDLHPERASFLFPLALEALKKAEALYQLFLNPSQHPSLSKLSGVEDPILILQDFEGKDIEIKLTSEEAQAMIAMNDLIERKEIKKEILDWIIEAVQEFTAMRKELQRLDLEEKVKNYQETMKSAGEKLEREQEKILFLALRKLDPDGPEHKVLFDFLVRQYSPFVKKWANYYVKRFKHRGVEVEFDDAVQYGVVGLMKDISNYDPMHESGSSFIHYAKNHQTRVAIEDGLGLRRRHYFLQSLDAKVPGKKSRETSRYDLIQDTKSPAPDDEMSRSEDISSLLRFLDPREQLVIKMRYGLDKEGERTLEQIGKMLELTKERVRQIELAAVEKMRSPKLGRNKYEVSKDHADVFLFEQIGIRPDHHLFNKLRLLPRPLLEELNRRKFFGLDFTEQDLEESIARIETGDTKLEDATELNVKNQQAQANLLYEKKKKTKKDWIWLLHYLSQKVQREGQKPTVANVVKTSGQKISDQNIYDVFSRYKDLTYEQVGMERTNVREEWVQTKKVYRAEVPEESGVVMPDKRGSAREVTGTSVTPEQRISSGNDYWPRNEARIITPKISRTETRATVTQPKVKAERRDEGIEYERAVFSGILNSIADGRKLEAILDEMKNSGKITASDVQVLINTLERENPLANILDPNKVQFDGSIFFFEIPGTGTKGLGQKEFNTIFGEALTNELHLLIRKILAKLLLKRSSFSQDLYYTYKETVFSVPAGVSISSTQMEFEIIPKLKKQISYILRRVNRFRKALDAHKAELVAKGIDLDDKSNLLLDIRFGISDVGRFYEPDPKRAAMLGDKSRVVADINAHQGLKLSRLGGSPEFAQFSLKKYKEVIQEYGELIDRLNQAELGRMESGVFHLNPEILNNPKQFKSRELFQAAVRYFEILRLQDYIKKWNINFEEASREAREVQTIINDLKGKLERGTQVTPGEKMNAAQIYFNSPAKRALIEKYVTTDARNRLAASLSIFHHRASEMKNPVYVSVDAIKMGRMNLWEFEIELQEILKEYGQIDAIDALYGERKKVDLDKVRDIWMRAADRVTEKRNKILVEIQRAVNAVYQQKGKPAPEQVLMRMGGDEVVAVLDRAIFQGQTLDEFFFDVLQRVHGIDPEGKFNIRLGGSTVASDALRHFEEQGRTNAKDLAHAKVTVEIDENTDYLKKLEKLVASGTIDSKYRGALVIHDLVNGKPEWVVLYKGTDGEIKRELVNKVLESAETRTSELESDPERAVFIKEHQDYFIETVMPELRENEHDSVKKLVAFHGDLTTTPSGPNYERALTEAFQEYDELAKDYNLSAEISHEQERVQKDPLRLLELPAFWTDSFGNLGFVLHIFLESGEEAAEDPKMQQAIKAAIVLNFLKGEIDRGKLEEIRKEYRRIKSAHPQPAPTIQRAEVREDQIEDITKLIDDVYQSVLISSKSGNTIIAQAAREESTSPILYVHNLILDPLDQVLVELNSYRKNFARGEPFQTSSHLAKAKTELEKIIAAIDEKELIRTLQVKISGTDMSLHQALSEALSKIQVLRAETRVTAEEPVPQTIPGLKKFPLVNRDGKTLATLFLFGFGENEKSQEAHVRFEDKPVTMDHQGVTMNATLRRSIEIPLEGGVATNTHRFLDRKGKVIRTERFPHDELDSDYYQEVRDLIVPIFALRATAANGDRNNRLFRIIETVGKKVGDVFEKGESQWEVFPMELEDGKTIGLGVKIDELNGQLTVNFPHEKDSKQRDPRQFFVIIKPGARHPVTFNAYIQERGEKGRLLGQREYEAAGVRVEPGRVFEWNDRNGEVGEEVTYAVRMEDIGKALNRGLQNRMKMPAYQVVGAEKSEAAFLRTAIRKTLPSVIEAKPQRDEIGVTSKELAVLAKHYASALQFFREDKERTSLLARELVEKFRVKADELFEDSRTSSYKELGFVATVFADRLKDLDFQNTHPEVQFPAVTFLKQFDDIFSTLFSNPNFLAQFSTDLNAENFKTDFPLITALFKTFPPTRAEVRTAIVDAKTEDILDVLVQITIETNPKKIRSKSQQKKLRKDLSSTADALYALRKKIFTTSEDYQNAIRSILKNDDRMVRAFLEHFTLEIFPMQQRQHGPKELQILVRRDEATMNEIKKGLAAALLQIKAKSMPNLEPLVHLAEKLNPHFSTTVPTGKLHKIDDVHYFDTFGRELNWKVFMPLGEVLRLNHYHLVQGVPHTMAFRINESSWQEHLYLGSIRIWSAEVNAAADFSVLGTTLTRFAFVDFSRVEQNVRKEEHPFIGKVHGDEISFRSKLNSLLSWQKSPLDLETLVQVGRDMVFFEELRHAQDHTFAEFFPQRRDLRFNPQKEQQAALKSIMRPDARLKPDLSRQKSEALFEFAGRMGGLLQQMDQYLEKEEYKKAYLAFVRFLFHAHQIILASLDGSMTRREYEGASSLIFQELLVTMELWGKHSLPELEKLILKKLDASGSDFKERSLWAREMVKKAYQASFWTDDERLRLIPVRAEVRVEKPKEKALYSQAIQFLAKNKTSVLQEWNQLIQNFRHQATAEKGIDAELDARMESFAEQLSGKIIFTLGDRESEQLLDLLNDILVERRVRNIIIKQFNSYPQLNAFLTALKQDHRVRRRAEVRALPEKLTSMDSESIRLLEAIQARTPGTAPRILEDLSAQYLAFRNEHLFAIRDVMLKWQKEIASDKWLRVQSEFEQVLADIERALPPANEHELFPPFTFSKAPEVVIIIPIYNKLNDEKSDLKRQSLVENLLTLQRLNYPKQKRKIMILDNGSPDEEFAREIKRQFPELTVIRLSTNQGFAGGVNAGIREAQKLGAQYFLVVNDDTVVLDNNILTKLIRVSEQKEIGLVGMPLVNPRQGKWVETRGLESLPVSKEKKVSTDQYEEVDGVAGSAFLLSQRLLDEMTAAGRKEPLDSRFILYFEETDLNTWLQHRGKINAILQTSRMTHKEEGGGIFNPASAKYLMRNSVFYVQQNFRGFRGLYLRYVWPLMHFVQFTWKMLSDRQQHQMGSNWSIIWSSVRGLVDGFLGRWSSPPNYEAQEITLDEAPSAGAQGRSELRLAAVKEFSNILEWKSLLNDSVPKERLYETVNRFRVIEPEVLDEVILAPAEANALKGFQNAKSQLETSRMIERMMSLDKNLKPEDRRTRVQEILEEESQALHLSFKIMDSEYLNQRVQNLVETLADILAQEQPPASFVAAVPVQDRLTETLTNASIDIVEAMITEYRNIKDERVLQYVVEDAAFMMNDQQLRSEFSEFMDTVHDLALLNAKVKIRIQLPKPSQAVERQLRRMLGLLRNKKDPTISWRNIEITYKTSAELPDVLVTVDVNGRANKILDVKTYATGEPVNAHTSKSGKLLAGFALLLQKLPEGLVQNPSKPDVYNAAKPGVFDKLFAATLRLMIQDKARKVFSQAA